MNFYTQSLTFLALKDKFKHFFFFFLPDPKCVWLLLPTLWLALPLPFLSRGRGVSTHASVAGLSQVSLLWGLTGSCTSPNAQPFPCSGKLLGPQGEGTGSSGLSGPESVVGVSAPSALSSRLLDPGSTLPWVGFHRGLRGGPALWFLPVLICLFWELNLSDWEVVYAPPVSLSAALKVQGFQGPVVQLVKKLRLGTAFALVPVSTQQILSLKGTELVTCSLSRGCAFPLGLF